MSKQNWNKHVKQTVSRGRCPLCPRDPNPPELNREGLERHLKDEHAESLEGEGEATNQSLQKYWESALNEQKHFRSQDQGPLSGQVLSQGATGRGTSAQPGKSGHGDHGKRQHQAASPRQLRVSNLNLHPSPAPGRVQLLQPGEDGLLEECRGPAMSAADFRAGLDHIDRTTPKCSSSHHLDANPDAGDKSTVTSAHPTDVHGPLELVRQPETRPISQEQLVGEVKGIYAGLVMVESKCIEVDNQHDSLPPVKQNSDFNKDKWRALISLHRTLLYEHHDFFLASQHPSASPALRRLAAKYMMPARMWRHGIHSFLELLRHRLPASMDHMLTFIYLAYSVMALLYETVPAFELTWIECLGDLARYRMAIEEANLRDREIWTNVSRQWYLRASRMSPTTGRLYHHLAILARPRPLEQLFLYLKALVVPVPFASARESIMTIMNPLLQDPKSAQFETMARPNFLFVRSMALMSNGRLDRELDDHTHELHRLLDHHVARVARKWMEEGYFMGLVCCFAIIGFGSQENPIFQCVRKASVVESSCPLVASSANEQPGLQDKAMAYASMIQSVVLKRYGDPNVLPFFHVTLVFWYHLASSTLHNGIAMVAPHVEWDLVATHLNILLADGTKNYDRIEGGQFSHASGHHRDQGDHDSHKKEVAPQPLPEDYVLRGLSWSDDGYMPRNWFDTHDEELEDGTHQQDTALTMQTRKERVLFLGCRLAEKLGGKWLAYEAPSHCFVARSVASQQGGNEAEGLSRTSEDSARGVAMGVLPDADSRDSRPGLTSVQRRAETEEKLERRGAILRSSVNKALDRRLEGLLVGRRP